MENVHETSTPSAVGASQLHLNNGSNSSTLQYTNTTTSASPDAAVQPHAAATLNPAFFPVLILCCVNVVMMFVNVAGCSLTLAAIRTTPSLWTKTNYILASLTVADLWVGLNVLWNVPYEMVLYTIGDMCSYRVSFAVQAGLSETGALLEYVSCPARGRRQVCCHRPRRVRSV